MPLNWRTPVPVPPVPAPSAVPVPLPRDGRVARAGRGVPPPSSVSGRARVLFWSVGGDTATGGSSLEARVCAQASVVFAAELSLLYALGLGFICLRARQPLAAGWILFLLLAGVGLEVAFKYNFTHAAPSAFMSGSISRMASY